MNHIDNQQNVLPDAEAQDELAVPAHSSDFLVEPADEQVADDVNAQDAEQAVAEQATNELDSDEFVEYSLPEYPQNTRQQYTTVKEELKVSQDEMPPGVLLPSHHIGVIEDVIENSSNEQLDSREGRRWSTVLLEGRKLHPRHAGVKTDPETGRRRIPGAYERTVGRQNAEFVQVVESNKGLLGAVKPSFDDVGHVKLTGEKAVNRILSLVGIGDTIKIPLWHSGIWITLKAPTERDLVELYRRLDSDKISLGRITSGAVLSNLNVVLADYLTEFITRHITETSYHDMGNVMNKIMAPDLEHLVWGLACTIYVNGFDYTRSVVSKDDNKKITVSEKINVSKIQWIDRNSLTESQIRHMTSRANGSMSEAAVNRYQEEFLVNRGRQVTIKSSRGQELTIDLKVPTLFEYIQIGNEWVGSLVTMVESALGVAADQNLRNDEIMRQGMATYLRMYSHWVESITAQNVTTSDREALDKILGNIGQDEQIREQMVKEITRFIDDVQVALIAMPALTDTEAATLPRFPHLVPFNVIQTFFILLVQRISSLPMADVL